MRKYLLIANLSFQNLTEYRFNFAMRILTNLIWYGAILIFWISLANSGMNIKPYTPKTLAVYYLLVGGLSTIVGFSYQEVADEIRDGKIAGAVTKPISYLLAKFFATFSDKAVMILIVALILMAANFLGVVELTLTLINTLLFAIALIFAMVGNFLVYFISALSAFWVKHTHGIPALLSVASNLISGSMVPIELLPIPILFISKIMPFRYFTFFPVQIFLGNFGFSDIRDSFAIELIWIALLILIYKWLWAKGMKQLEVIGT